MATRNRTWCDMRFSSSRVQSVKLIKSFLTIVNEVERFSSRKISFSINIIFEERQTISPIEFEVQNTIDILSSFAILSYDRFARFLTLAR